MSGRVVLVGAGPGGLDLIAAVGLRALRGADVIVIDRLVPETLLAEAGGRAEVILVGKTPHGRFTPQERINEIFVEQTLAGRVMARSKSGDPFVFRRGYEERLACIITDVPVSYVSDAFSFIVGVGLAGIPVAQHSITQGYTVISGHVPPGNERCGAGWEGPVGSGLTLAIMMGVFHLPRVTGYLIEAELDLQTPPTMVESAGLLQMRVLYSAVGEIARIVKAEGVCSPAVTTIGRVAGLGA